MLFLLIIPRFFLFVQQLSDDLNELQTEMMNKITDVQELKLVLHGLRTDEGQDLGADLEQVTIELKLDEVVRQHIVKLKQQQQSSTPLHDEHDLAVVNDSAFEQALTEAVSSSGRQIPRCFSPFDFTSLL